MQITSWRRAYVINEGFYLIQESRYGSLRYVEELRYGPFTYDEYCDAVEWVVFGKVEELLHELEHDQELAQQDQAETAGGDE